MKKLLSLLLSTLFLGIFMVAADNGPKEALGSESQELIFDKVVLDSETADLLTFAFFSRSSALREGKRRAYIPTMSGIHKEEFKQYRAGIATLLSDLVSQCQKQSADIIDPMNNRFNCKELNDLITYSELVPRVMEINDSLSLFGGYAKEVKPSAQAHEKFKRLKQNMFDAGSLRSELDRPLANKKHRGSK